MSFIQYFLRYKGTGKPNNRKIEGPIIFVFYSLFSVLRWRSNCNNTEYNVHCTHAMYMYIVQYTYIIITIYTSTMCAICTVHIALPILVAI